MAFAMCIELSHIAVNYIPIYFAALIHSLFQYIFCIPQNKIEFLVELSQNSSFPFMQHETFVLFCFVSWRSS